MKSNTAAIIVLALLFSAQNPAQIFPVGQKETPIRVLSLDGGGIRGVLEAYYLMQIEAAAKKPIHELFDIIAGTSTGGIIALGLTIPNKSGAARFSAEELYDLYATKGESFFKKTWSFLGLKKAKYSASALEYELKSYFNEASLKEALTPVLITSYSLNHESGVLFFSEKARQDPLVWDFPAWLVARATSAAPTYYEPLAVEVPKGTGHMGNLTDGGLYRNNPALLAYLEAKELYPDREIEVYSLGTGRLEKPIPEERGRGMLSWIAPVIHHMFVGVSQGDSDALHRLLNHGPSKHYFRINTRLDTGHEQLDDTTKWNMDYLNKKARSVVQTTQFRSMVAHLLERDIETVWFPLRENGHNLVPSKNVKEDPFVLIPNNEAS